MLPPRPDPRPPRRSIGDVVLRAGRLSARGARPSARRREGRHNHPRARLLLAPRGGAPRSPPEMARALSGTRYAVIPPARSAEVTMCPPPPPSRVAATRRERAGRTPSSHCQRRHVTGEQGEAPPFRFLVNTEPGEGRGSAVSRARPTKAASPGEAGIFVDFVFCVVSTFFVCSEKKLAMFWCESLRYVNRWF